MAASASPLIDWPLAPERAGTGTCCHSWPGLSRGGTAALADNVEVTRKRGHLRRQSPMLQTPPMQGGDRQRVPVPLSIGHWHLNRQGLAHAAACPGVGLRRLQTMLK